jgi:hypothetical protein
VWSALTHITRNAVDHGLLPKEERTGQLELEARSAGGELLLTFADNGRGVDWDKVRERAAATGLPSSTLEDLEQALVLGAHGCVGGGSKEERGLSDGALLWMMEQVKKLGLALDATHVEDGINPNFKATFLFTSLPTSPNLKSLSSLTINLSQIL